MARSLLNELNFQFAARHCKLHELVAHLEQYASDLADEGRSAAPAFMREGARRLMELEQQLHEAQKKSALKEGR